MLNLLRPTVANAYFIVFAALALHRHPQAQDELKTGSDEAVENFVQEVRRSYPVFPFAAARVAEPFDWAGCHLPRGRRVLLDLYGTNHDGRIWDAPEHFRPSRFQHHRPGAFELILQGGGAHEANHRCAGEWINIELMKVAVRFLTSGINYRVPEQDLTIPLDRFPTSPASGFVITDVQPPTTAAESPG